MSDHDRYGILPRKAAGTRDKQGVEYVSAAAVQAGLHNRVEGTASTSGQDVTYNKAAHMGLA